MSDIPAFTVPPAHLSVSDLWVVCKQGSHTRRIRMKVVCRSAADRLCPDAAAHPCLFSWAFLYSSFHSSSSLGLGLPQCTKQMGVSQRACASWQAGVLHGWLHLNTKARIDTVDGGHVGVEGQPEEPEKTKYQMNTAFNNKKQLNMQQSGANGRQTCNL